MSSYDPQKIEEYQMILLNNPRSQVFAALAEAYRKMGLLEEALETTQKGLKHNPEFVSGLVAQAKVLFEMKLYESAIPVLEKSLNLRHENILARRLLAHCSIKTKNYEEALAHYKRLLVFAPSDEGAIKFIKNWEFLEAEGFDSKDFPESLEEWDHWIQALPDADKVISLIEVYLEKENKRVAHSLIDYAESKWPNDGRLIKLKLLATQDEDEESMIFDPYFQVRKDFYARLLHRIESRKKIDPLTDA